ncbi:uncharacterized protein JCM10292_002523 [Rhodotorula paludigena]|uniref:uncharacterized protein n=1 Tax=Rhodotorula paludigena TaxID=86838 RepID=UPI00317C67AC
MAPAASKNKSYGGIVATQIDDVKYRQKVKEIKQKVQEIEEDNTKLSVKILKSKKAIQRLRIERAILYDRLQSTVAPTNPYALSSAAHLSTLASSSTSTDPNAPATILAAPPYPLADPAAPDLFLKQLDAQKLAALEQGAGAATRTEYGERPIEGVVGEAEAGAQQRALLEAGGPVNGHGGTMAGGSGAAATGAAQDQPHPSGLSAPAAPPAAVPQAVEVSHAQAQQMQIDHA